MLQEELVIQAGRTEKNYWSDLWRYRADGVSEERAP
jgi:hypothetical protein